MARERDSERMRFSVADDGYDFDTARCPNSVEGHFGLLGIRKCVQYFNGTFTLSSGSGRERMRFSVADDGYGFDTARCPNSVEGHFGLLGIRKCVQYFNGPFTLSSGSGRGTKAMVTLY